MCDCKPGYQTTYYQGYNGTFCEDINECEINQHRCLTSQTCENTNSSYKCTCQEGFKMIDNHCVDIDECEFAAVLCDDKAKCINTYGSYYCRCENGYYG